MKAYQNLVITGSLNVSGTLLLNGEPVGSGSSGGASVIVSSSAPLSQSVGTLWYNTESDTSNGGELFIQLQDPSGNTWVPASDNITAYSVSSSQADSASFAISSSFVVSASLANTASFVPGAPYKIGTTTGIVPFNVEASASRLSDVILGGSSGSAAYVNQTIPNGGLVGQNNLIGNGQNNTIHGTSYGTILNGSNNLIASGSNQSIILGGRDNTIENNSNSAIIGSYGKISTSNIFYSANAIVGGEGNIISQSRNVIVGGYYNTVSASSYAVVMGQSVSATGRDNAIVLGSNLTASYNNTFHTNNLFVSGNVVGGFNISGSQKITGSLSITGSQTITGSLKVSGSITGSLDGYSTYTKGRYASWAPYMSTDPLGMGATGNLGLNLNGGENGIQLTNTSTGGIATINWSSTSIDWKQDFRISAVIYINNTAAPTITTGDGFVLYAGTTTVPSTIYANENDNGLKYRLFTYQAASDQVLHPSGSTFWLGNTKGPQGRTNTVNSIGTWAKYVVEVATDRVTNKRMASVYMHNDVNYGGKWFLAGMDVTSWEPTGTNFGFYCATGAAKEDLYINSIMFEAL